MERMPKNIRQIGEREDRLKTYMEDYVGTYLRKLQEEREENGAVGMLTGSWQREGGNDCVFISGALEVREAHTDGGQLHMTDSAWDEAYGSLGTYFSGQELCGIFVCEGICRRFRRQALFAAVRECFPDNTQALLFVLTEEGEEIFYWVTKRDEKRLQGYLCYFERNEAMQEYMMDHLNRRQVEKEELPARRRAEREDAAKLRSGGEASWQMDKPAGAARGSEGAFGGGGTGAAGNAGQGMGADSYASGKDPVESFRERMQRQQEEKGQQGAPKTGGRGVFGLCAVMAVVVFVSGFLLMQREQGGVRIADLLKQLQIDPSQLLAVSGQPESDTEETLVQSRPVVVEEVPGNVYPTEGDKPVAEPSGGDAAGAVAETLPPPVQEETAGEGNASETPTTPDSGGDPAIADGQSAETSATEAPATDPPATDAETDAPPPTEAPASTGVTYVVEAGDSLYSISRKFYGTEAMVSKIQELNGLSNADLIKEGQSLILP